MKKKCNNLKRIEAIEEEGDLGSDILNVLKLSRESRNNNGRYNDLAMGLVMSGCRILFWWTKSQIMVLKIVSIE